MRRSIAWPRALRNGKRTTAAAARRGPAARGREAAGRIAAKSGARLAHDFFAARVTRGAGLPPIERIPYFAEDIVESFKGLEQLILVGAPPPVTFFAYPGKPSWVTPEGCEIITLSHPHEDGVAALERGGGGDRRAEGGRGGARWSARSCRKAN